MPSRTNKHSTLPKKIKIGHLSYQVKYVKDLRNDEGSRLYGQHRPSDQIICLDADLSLEREKEVVLHELLHAIWCHYQLPKDNEERYVECIGNGLATIFADNPKLRRFFDASV